MNASAVILGAWPFRSLNSQMSFVGIASRRVLCAIGGPLHNANVNLVAVRAIYFQVAAVFNDREGVMSHDATEHRSFRFGVFTADTARGTVLHGGETIPLTARA